MEIGWYLPSHIFSVTFKLLTIITIKEGQKIKVAQMVPIARKIFVSFQVITIYLQFII